MNGVIVYHGHCFDGMASAALFARFLRERNGESIALTYRGLDHQPGGSFVPDEALTGDVNAIVDFRYSSSARLDWYFDHHATGILESDRAHFEASNTNQKFFDPSYSSCCKLIADVLSDRYGFRADELAPLVECADRIDSARFPDAATLVELRDPALQLATVIEEHGDDAFLSPRIDALSRGESVQAIANDPVVQTFFAVLLEEHVRTCERIRVGARFESSVVAFELVGTGTDRYNKFIPYWLYPESTYAVAVTAGPTRAKVSVGRNPWSTQPLRHHIGALCSQYGGGGHAHVGAVSLKPHEIERACAIAREITYQLQRHPS